MSEETLERHTLAVLAATPGVVRALLEPLPAEAVETPADGDWSPKDVVAHLVSLDPLTTIDRIERLLDGREVANVDEREAMASFGGQELGRLLEDFSVIRARAVNWLRSLTPEQLGRRGEHTVAGPISVANVIHHKAFHDLDHCRQLLTMIAGPLDARRGGMGIF